MFTTIFKQKAGKALLVAALLAGITAIGAVPAAGQTKARNQSAFMPAQQAAYTLATGLSPYERRLLAIAVMKLGPQRANVEFTELAQLSVAMPGFLPLVGPRIITPALQTIPAQYHQYFVDGLLSVTPAEELYAKQVMARLVQILQIQAQRAYMPQPYTPQPLLAFPPSMGAGNSDGDPITQRDVWKWGRDLSKMNYDTFRRGQNMNPGLNMPD